MGGRETVEGALFAAGRPLAETGLARPPRPEGGGGGGHPRMKLRGEYADRAKAFAQPELARDVLKTAALIAYHQPIPQARLVEMVGDRAYEHVKELEDRNLIVTKPAGRSIELTTSRYFPEFFGLKANDPVEIKRYLASLAGRTGAPRGTPQARTGPAPN